MNSHVGVVRSASVPVLLLGLLLAACDTSGGPIQAGRYAYTAAHVAPGGADTIRLQGVLAVEEAHGDTVEGQWDVPQLHPELRVVDAEDDALILIAHPTYFGTLHHRVSRSGRGISCSGEYVWVAEGGEERSMPMTCSLALGADPVLPEELEPETVPPDRAIEADTFPAVRPIDSDTVSGP